MVAVAVAPEAMVVLVNATVVAGALCLGGAWLARGTLSVDAPSARQNVGEAILSFFYGKARDMAEGPKRDRIIRTVAPLLATFFLFILCCNLIAILPLPVVNRPPTSHFAFTLGLGLAAIGGTLGVASAVRGVGATLRHLFWPNPLQWVSEVTDVMSLSLRLFGNIAGEYMTLLLVLAVVPWGIPLILHMLGLIPAFVQALVFTLLTSSFIASAIHHDKKRARSGRSTSAASAA